MAWHYHTNYNPRYTPRFLYAEPFDITAHPFNKARPIPPEVAPRTAILQSSHKTFGALTLVSGVYGVTEPLRDAIEGLEPGVHQFFPITLRRKSGEEIEGPYFLLNVLQLIDCIIWEQSNAYLLPSGIWSKGKGDPRYALRRDAVRGRHLWLHPHPYFRDFISDALKSVFDALGVKALVYHEAPEV
jgi:hypothetical protein